MLKGEKVVPLIKIRTFEEKKAAATQLQASPAFPGDPELIELLKTVRKKLAIGRGIPPYVIFSDKTLKDMAVKLPKDAREFLQVHGVGDVKAKSYGKKFLKAIRDYGASQQPEGKNI